MRHKALAGFLMSAALIVVVGYPWGDMVGHAHWSKVGWIPFSSPYDRLRDEITNVLLCVPLGIFAALAFRRGVRAAAATALVLSCFVEVTQSYTHTRFPSATDLVCNVAGAAVAAAVVRRVRRLASGETDDQARARLARR